MDKKELLPIPPETPVPVPGTPPPSYFDTFGPSSTSGSAEPSYPSSSFFPSTSGDLSKPSSSSKNSSPFSPSSSSSLYCVGGKNLQETFRISKLNPKGSDWESVYVNFESVRHSFAAASIGSKIFIAGGNDGQREKKGLAVYDCRYAPNMGGLIKLAKLPYKLEGCAMTALDSTSLLLTGGQHRNSSTFRGVNTAYRYSLKLNTWQTVAPMNYDRAGHSLVSFRDHIYAIGGSGALSACPVEQYNPFEDSWSKFPVEILSQKAVSAAAHEGAIYVCNEESFDMFVPGTQNSELELPLPNNCRANSLVSFDGKLLSIGGCRGDTVRPTNMVLQFDARNRSWIRLPDMDCGRKKHSCVVVDY